RQTQRKRERDRKRERGGGRPTGKDNTFNIQHLFVTYVAVKKKVVHVIHTLEERVKREFFLATVALVLKYPSLIRKFIRKRLSLAAILKNGWHGRHIVNS